MDLTGNIWTILIGCLTFFFIFLYFLTRQDTHIQFQMITVMGLALVATVVLLWDKFMDKLYRPLRGGIFSCIGLLRPCHRKLPAELDREIFLFLKPAAQRKFIWGMNWDFYAMFRYRLLTKTKRVRNSHGNRWNNTNTTTTVEADGLHVSSYTNGWHNIYAEKEFSISGPQCRVDEFPGTILYYYEIKGHFPIQLSTCFVGLSGVDIHDHLWIGHYSNSYSIPLYAPFQCSLAGETHLFELPEGAIQPEENGNVYGCGLVLDPEDNLAIFFTLNGQLLDRKIPINPTVERLFPAVTMGWSGLEANFGDDSAKPFEYDIKNCPGLELACI